jgi:NAD+ diphosphatase
MLLPRSFAPLWTCPPETGEGGYWFVVQAGKLLVTTATPLGLSVPEVPSSQALPLPVSGQRFIGVLEETGCWAAAADPEITALPEGFAFEPVRQLFDRLPDDLLAIAGRAGQVVDFDRTHRYCGTCATPTEIADECRARGCPRCGEVSYPRIAPAIMALIKRDSAAGRELLLARGARFQTPIYSALAGFVEPSESLEDCIHREVLEEVGVRVRHLRYFGSESWPFPHSLMIGFVADYDSGEIVCQAGEIVDAQWFPLNRLPRLPHRLSLARSLINATIAEVAPEHPVLAESAR